MRQSRMFAKVTKTYNPVKGCLHGCYPPKGCYANQLAHGKLKTSERYKDGFTPRLIEEELNKTFGKNHLVFVSDMGDLFGEWVPAEWIVRVLDVVRRADKSNKFLFLTKNPRRYSLLISQFPENSILGTTIETNRNVRSLLGLTSAPDPVERYDWMRVLPWPHKFVSIEPIIDFDHNILLRMIKDIEPEAVAVGYDNWSCGLPEPSLDKTMKLIEALERFTDVWRKTLREGT